MVLHGSERTLGKALRRTIYYEFRAADMIFEEGPWDKDWIDKRMRLIPLGLKRFAQHYPNHEQFDWQVSNELRPTAVGDDATELKVAHVWHTSGSYCSASSAPAEVVERAMARLEVIS